MKRILSESKISERVCGFLRSDLLDERIQITPNSSLIALGLDSVSLVTLVLFIESEFGVSVPDVALTPENLRTVEALAHCIHELDCQSRG
jgi:acyl carrier protein